MSPIIVVLILDKIGVNKLSHVNGVTIIDNYWTNSNYVIHLLLIIYLNRYKINYIFK